MDFFTAEGNQLRCLLCGHRCLLDPGQTGLCGVRSSNGQLIVSASEGRISAVHSDPMEKKPLFHFLPGRKILSIGGWGCNFRCPWCQNWEISQSRPLEFSETHPEPWELVALALQEKTPAIGFTYNEPAMMGNYLLETLSLARAKGLATVMVSNGYFSPTLTDALIPLVQGFNIDLKHHSPQSYRKLTTGRLEIVKESVEELHRAGNWVEVTSLIIPGMNDVPSDWDSLAGWMADLSPDIPWHITGFHPNYKMKQLPPTSPQTLSKVAERIRSQGMRYVYTGNIHGSEENTHCPSCSSLLIRRKGYQTLVEGGFSGRCPHCSMEVPGRWLEPIISN